MKTGPLAARFAGNTAAVSMALISVILTGCQFLDVPQQQQRLNSICRIQGTVEVAGRKPDAIVVLSLRKPEEAGAPSTWKVVDHFVLDQPGRWAFPAIPERSGSRR